MRRILVYVLIVTMLMVCNQMEAIAIEVQIGDDLYFVDSDVDFETSIEIETKKFDVNGILEQLSVDEQRQYLRDYITFVLVVDAIQHNDYLDTTKLTIESLIDVVRFVTGEEEIEVVSDGDFNEIWISSQCYFEILKEAGAIHKITLVMPELENGFGNTISIDLLINE